MGLKEYRRKRNLCGGCMNIAVTIGILGALYTTVSIGSAIEGSIGFIAGMGQAGIGAGIILVAYIAYKAAGYLEKKIIQKRFQELWDKK